LEHLPESVENFHYSISKKKDAKVKAIYNLFANEQGIVETKKEKDQYWGKYIKNFPQKLQDLKNS